MSHARDINLEDDPKALELDLASLALVRADEVSRRSYHRPRIAVPIALVAIIGAA